MYYAYVVTFRVTTFDIYNRSTASCVPCTPVLYSVLCTLYDTSFNVQHAMHSERRLSTLPLVYYVGNTSSDVNVFFACGPFNEVSVSLRMTKRKSVVRCGTQFQLAGLFCTYLFVFRSLRHRIHSETVVHVPFGIELERIRDSEGERGLDASSEHVDKREITITNFGWFHSDPSKGITTVRSQAMKHFNDAILSHVRFNASAWQDLHQNPNPKRAIIAFLDYDSCRLFHWPKFNGREFNSDVEFGRQPFATVDFSKECSIVERALRSPALSSPDSRLVVLSCKDDGPPSRRHCLGANRTVAGIYSKLIVGHMSAHKHLAHPLDFGIPPWPVKTVALNESQIQEIETCQNTSRSLLFSFVGRQRLPFPEFHKYLEPLHQTGGIHAVFQWDHYTNSEHPPNVMGDRIFGPVAPENQTQDDFYNLLTNSVFVGAPRGDCLYSVRFSEILSSGAIPVVFADGWVLPYNRDVVDWSEVAVLLPQRLVNQTMDVLRAIPDETRCQMRKKGFQVFQRYVADSAGRLRAILQVVDAALARQKTTSDPPMEFSSAPD